MPCSSRNDGRGSAEQILQRHSGMRNRLWEPRPRGDAEPGALLTFDRGEGATPTKTPSPLVGDKQRLARLRAWSSGW
jgi:hypothetical protein